VGVHVGNVQDVSQVSRKKLLRPFIILLLPLRTQSRRKKRRQQRDRKYPSSEVKNFRPLERIRWLLEAPLPVSPRADRGALFMRDNQNSTLARNSITRAPWLGEALLKLGEMPPKPKPALCTIGEKL
jgi:hypothetical protein